MNGRQEHTILIENKIKKDIENAPGIIRDYYYSLGNKTATTKRAYIRYITNLKDYFKGRDLKSLKRSDLNQYMDAIKYNADGGENKVSIRCARLAAIKNFYKFLYEEGHIDQDPAVNINPPRCSEEKEIVALTPGEINIVKNNIISGMGSHEAKEKQGAWKNRDMAIITLGFNTGLRCTAITEINMDDIDFEKKTIRVTEKGNRIKNVYLGDETINIVKKWFDERKNIDIPTNALFISNRNKRIAQNSIAALLKKYTANIGKNVTPHKMRSSCATNLYDKTGDIYLVQAVLGHKNIQNTERYAKMSSEKKINAANILDGLY